MLTVFGNILVLWEQYQEFLSQKKNAIEEQIIAGKYHGVSNEQLKEIEDSFHQSDTDNDGCINHPLTHSIFYTIFIFLLVYIFYFLYLFIFLITDYILIRELSNNASIL